MNVWCWIGVAFCYSATCLLACLGVRRAQELVEYYKDVAATEIDEYADLHARFVAVVDERNELRARLKRDQPRGKHGRYVSE